MANARAQNVAIEEASPDIVEQVVDGVKKRYRMVEIVVDPGITIIRKTVEIDYDEEDLPEGATLLSEDETQGILSRAARPDPIEVGCHVRLAPPKGQPDFDNSLQGSIDAKLKSGGFRVKWDDGTSGRYKKEQLMRIW